MNSLGQNRVSLEGRKIPGGVAQLPVVCWSGICGLGSIEIGSLGPINMLPFDPKFGFPESRLGLLPDINKPPLLISAEVAKRYARIGSWITHFQEKLATGVKEDG